MPEIGWVDWAFLAVLAFSLLLGAWRGLVVEVLSVFAWIAAFVLAQWLAPDVAPRLPMGGAPDAVRYAGGFLVVFIAVVFAGALLGWLIKKMVAAVGLSPIDRTLGAVFGLLRGMLLLMALAVVVDMTPLKQGPWWTESMGAGVATSALKNLRPVLPERFGQYLPG